jgi:hypothetical protein
MIIEQVIDSTVQYLNYKNTNYTHGGDNDDGWFPGLSANEGVAVTIICIIAFILLVWRIDPEIH